MIQNISYSREAFGDMKAQISRAKKALEGVDFDTMIGTGLSGSMVIPELARAMGKSWAIIRKNNDGSHASMPFEGEIGDRWVFVDDFISSGATKARVRAKVSEIAAAFGEPTEYVGDYEYSRGNDEAGQFSPALSWPRW